MANVLMVIDVFSSLQQAKTIASLTKSDPMLRPSAKELLESELFLSKSQVRILFDSCRYCTCLFDCCVLSHIFFCSQFCG